MHADGQCTLRRIPGVHVKTQKFSQRATPPFEDPEGQRLALVDDGAGDLPAPQETPSSLGEKIVVPPFSSGTVPAASRLEPIDPSGAAARGGCTTPTDRKILRADKAP